MKRQIRATAKGLVAAFLVFFCGGFAQENLPQAEFKIGTSAHALIRKFEGFSSKAYPDAITGGAPWAYGYGFTTKVDGSPVQPSDTISKKQADVRLAKEAEKHCGAEISKISEKFLTQNRIDAATSLCWNLGSFRFAKSSFFKKWAVGDIEGAAKAMQNWVASGTAAEKHLRARRRIEAALFRAKETPIVGNS